VSVRLADDHRSGDGEIARALAAAVRTADLIADRRDAEATRVAEHTLTVVTLQEAETLGDHATQREANHLDTAKQSEEAWSARLHALGFARVILPADFAGWLTRRGAALEADAERAVAEQAGDALRERIDDARKQIAEALADAGVVVPDDAQLVVRAREREIALTTVAGDRTRRCGDIEAANAIMAEMEIDAAERTRTRTTLDGDLQRLAHEAGLPEQADEAMLIDAVEAFAQIADEIGARDGLARQIEGIERDRLAFGSDLDGLVAELGAAREGPAIDQVRLLAAELRDAVRREGELAGHAAEVSRLTGELERVERRLTTAQSTLDKLVSTAGVVDDAALDKVVADHALRAGLLVAERDALGELAGLDNGVGMDLLANEVAALSAEDEAIARSSIEERRRDVATEREEVGRALNAAEDEAARAATESVAADAQQVATETTAALAQAAEEHVETAAAAALLRWMLDRHRATNQAPLIARAGALFARVTGGAFSGLTVGYGDNDRPVILATRSDDAEVGVEGLSEGTRDQLFLALRLGSIEGRATGGALPVICDDLLITADDERAAALLTVLAAAAAHTQVIVFSHHHHLVEVAGRAIGTEGFRLHRIEPAALATAA
jgi:uncharacterized protein YhaN